MKSFHFLLPFSPGMISNEFKSMLKNVRRTRKNLGESQTSQAESYSILHNLGENYVSLQHKLKVRAATQDQSYFTISFRMSNAIFFNILLKSAESRRSHQGDNVGLSVQILIFFFQRMIERCSIIATFTFKKMFFFDKTREHFNDNKLTFIATLV